MQRTVSLRHFAAFFLLWYAIFLLAASGTLGLDTSIRREVTRSILMRGDLTAGGIGRLDIPQPDGTTRNVSFYPVGQSLLMIPLESVFLALEPLLPQRHRRRAGELLHALVFFPAVGALAVVLAAKLALELGFSTRRALGYASLTGAATPWLTYLSGAQEVSQGAVLLLGGGLLAWRGVRQASVGQVFLGLQVLCLATWLRLPHAMDTMALVGLLAAACWRLPQRTRMLLVLFGSYAVGGFLSIAITGLTNWMRFGNPLETGYALFFQKVGIDPFSLPSAEGLLGALWSLDFGLIPNAPIVGIALLALRTACGQARLLALTGWGLTIFSMALMSRYVAYSGGDFSIGPRFQAHLYLLLLLPLAAVPRGRWMLAVLSIAAFSIPLQLGFRALSPGLDFRLQPGRVAAAPYIEMTGRQWPGRAVLRAQALEAALDGSLERALGNPTDSFTLSLIEWDVWWLRLGKYGAAARWGALVSALLLSAIAIGCIAYLLNALKSTPGNAPLGARITLRPDPPQT